MTRTEKGEYITFIIELEAAIDETLEYIEECINEHKTSFMATNPKTKKLEEVPVRNALDALKFLYQEATSRIIGNKDLIENLYIITYEHLHNATRLLVFYFENRLFYNVELEKKILNYISMYYEARDIVDEQLKDKLIYNSR